jgi:hypothetical protein
VLTQSKRATAGTVTPQMDALAGAPMSNHAMEMTMDTNTPARPGGATTAISPSLGKAYRSGAKSVDQLLVELVDQFKLDAMAIDPTITGAWLARDMTMRGRDPGGAVHGLFLERENSPLVRKAGA